MLRKIFSMILAVLLVIVLAIVVMVGPFLFILLSASAGFLFMCYVFYIALTEKPIDVLDVEDDENKDESKL